MEWLKPVMFTAGVGLLDDRHAKKFAPETGMVVCKIGGPAYRYSACFQFRLWLLNLRFCLRRIGMGGGAASSRVSGGGNAAELALDFNAV